MDGLLDEAEQIELLSQREKPLTRGQHRELEKLEKLALQFETTDNLAGFDSFSRVGPGRENISTILRNRQRRILRDERQSRIKLFGQFLVDILDKISKILKQIS